MATKTKPETKPETKPGAPQSSGATRTKKDHSRPNPAAGGRVARAEAQRDRWLRELVRAQSGTGSYSIATARARLEAAKRRLANAHIADGDKPAADK